MKNDQTDRNVKLYYKTDNRLKEAFKNYGTGRTTALFLSVLVELGLDVLDVYCGKKLEKREPPILDGFMEGIDVGFMTKGFMPDTEPLQPGDEQGARCKIIPFRNPAA